MKSFAAYIGNLAKTSFSIWWAVATGLVTTAAYLKLESIEIKLPSWLLVFALFFVSALSFLCFVSVRRGYHWFVEAHLNPKVKECFAATPEAPHLYFRIESVRQLHISQVLSVYRKMEWGLVIPIGLIRVDSIANSDTYQCSELLILETHRQDLKQKKVQSNHLTVSARFFEKDIEPFLPMRELSDD